MRTLQTMAACALLLGCTAPAPERAAARREPHVRATSLPALETQARADLARALGVEVSTIAVVQRVPRAWTPAQLRCQATDEAGAAAMPGFELHLRHRQRTFTYRTDAEHAIACPAIAAR